jgi:hypothetical protein
MDDKEKETTLSHTCTTSCSSTPEHLKGITKEEVTAAEDHLKELAPAPVDRKTASGLTLAEIFHEIDLLLQEARTPDNAMKMVELVQSVPYLPKSMKSLMYDTATAYRSAFGDLQSALEEEDNIAEAETTVEEGLEETPTTVEELLALIAKKDALLTKERALRAKERALDTQQHVFFSRIRDGW